MGRKHFRARALYFDVLSDYSYKRVNSWWVRNSFEEFPMTVRYFALPGVSCAILLGLVLASHGVAKDKDTKPQNLQGKVQMMNPDNSTITVEQKGGVRRQVLYSADTKFLLGHSKNAKVGALDQVREGSFISCNGAFNDKVQLVAKECVYRDAK
jgi:hypothetical protein